jgi:hypothetical protein
MSQDLPSEQTVREFRERFPSSLVGMWSTFGDDYQMEFGHSVTFRDDGTGVSYLWDALVDEEMETPFQWKVRQGFEVEVAPCDPAKGFESDWGTFVVDFYLGTDAYGTRYVAIRDGGGAQNREPFWWFRDPNTHPLRLQTVDT